MSGNANGDRRAVRRATGHPGPRRWHSGRRVRGPRGAQAGDFVARCRQLRFWDRQRAAVSAGLEVRKAPARDYAALLR